MQVRKKKKKNAGVEENSIKLIVFSGNGWTDSDCFPFGMFFAGGT